MPYGGNPPTPFTKGGSFVFQTTNPKLQSPALWERGRGEGKLANPMCNFLGCHPECSEGSQVFAGIADEDMKSIPT